jgi:hypothetical protein
VVVGCLLGGVLGCEPSAEDRAAALQGRLDDVHASYLERRSLHPFSTGTAALEVLDPAAEALETASGTDSVTLVLPIAAGRLGACLRVTVRGAAGGAGRGQVTTEPVACSISTGAFRALGMDVDRLTTDLRPRTDDVPPR